MVESTVSNSARMVGRISANYRWGVTGTPINNGLEVSIYAYFVELQMLNVITFNLGYVWFDGVFTCRTI